MKPDNLYKDDALHASLLLFNELLRVANAAAEQRRLDIEDTPTSDNVGTVIGRNPVTWLTEPVGRSAVESRTASALVTENYYGEVGVQLFPVSK